MSGRPRAGARPRLRFLGYRLPLRHPWRTAAGVYQARAGWLVRAEDGEGAWGLGDCAPMREAGTEAPPVARRALRRAAGRRAPAPPLATPAARCAVEAARLDLEARRAGRPLCRTLRPGCRLEVAVAAACGGLDEGLAARARAATERGFRVLKVKVAGDPERAAAALGALAAGLPEGVSLRLDANRAWPPGPARCFVEAVAGLPVESLEEPLGEGPAEALAALQDICDFPLALDESLAGPDAPGLVDGTPARRVVLKPAVLGGLRRALDLARRARRRGLEVVVTSLLDSAVGVRAAAHLAAALGPGPAHGLDTGRWLAEDVTASPGAGGPVLSLRGPGLGLAAPAGAWSPVPRGAP